MVFDFSFLDRCDDIERLGQAKSLNSDRSVEKFIFRVFRGGRNLCFGRMNLFLKIVARVHCVRVDVRIVTWRQLDAVACPCFLWRLQF